MKKKYYKPEAKVREMHLSKLITTSPSEIDIYDDEPDVTQDDGTEGFGKQW